MAEGPCDCATQCPNSDHCVAIELLHRRPGTPFQATAVARPSDQHHDAERQPHDAGAVLGILQRRGTAHVSQTRQSFGGTSHASPAVGRRRDRLVGPGSTDCRRRRARGQEARPSWIPRLGADRRFRARRRQHVGSVRACCICRSRQPHCRAGRQSAGPAG